MLPSEQSKLTPISAPSAFVVPRQRAGMKSALNI
jgi:hypothetical protein